MHDPWAKKLFLGFARTSGFNGPRQPVALHPLIQELNTDLPILEPMLQLPYRIFGSSPPMSNFDPAKMLTVSLHHFCCVMWHNCTLLFMFALSSADLHNFITLLGLFGHLVQFLRLD
jgi:hypothetical protein